METNAGIERETISFARGCNRETVHINAGTRSDGLGKRIKKSEVCVCFPPLILQRNKDIVKTSDIRKLISKRLQFWKEERFLDLISEAETCDKKLPKNHVKMSDEKEIQIFTRLLLGKFMKQPDLSLKSKKVEV